MIIYEPKGAALEYSELACNLYTGCEHGCAYCYVPRIPPWRYKSSGRADFHSASTPRNNVLQLLAKDADKLRDDPRWILLCFTCDPFQVGRDNSTTMSALDIMAAASLNVQVLTKGGMEAAAAFPVIRDAGWKFATTMTFLSEARSKEVEPNAAPPLSRIESIELAHSMGISTWVSLEPVISPDETLAIIRRLKGHVNFWKVGKLNYDAQSSKAIDWHKFVSDVTRELSGEQYLVKDSLKPYLDSADKI
jgi:DNA repair photolyase